MDSEILHRHEEEFTATEKEMNKLAGLARLSLALCIVQSVGEFNGESVFYEHVLSQKGDSEIHLHVTIKRK